MSFINKIKIENVEYDIKDTNENEFLKNKGHYENIDSLPKPVQFSGEVGTHPSTFEIDPTKVDIQIPELPIITTMPEGIPLPYVVGVYLDEDNYMYVATDTPEYIESFSYSLDGSYCFRFPLTFYPNEQGGYTQAKVSARYRYNGLDGMIPDMTDGFLCAMDEMLADPNWDIKYASFRMVGMVEQGPGTIFGYIGGNGRAKIFGNLPTTLKYKNHLEFSGKKIPMPPLNLGTPDGVEEIPNAFSDSLTLAFKNNYTYTDGMDILRFDENYNAYWITDEEGAKENDLATVGENNEIHVVNANNEWEQWGKPSNSEPYMKNIGHVDNVDELPEATQVSGEVGEHPSIFEEDPTKFDIVIPTLPNLETLIGTKTPYVFGFYVDSENYFFVGTDNSSLIEGFSYSLDGSYCIYINPTNEMEKDIVSAHACYNGIFTQGPPGMDQDGMALQLLKQDIEQYNQGNYNNMIGVPFEMPIRQPSILFNYLGGKGPVRIFGNLTTTVKYKPHLSRAFKKIGPSYEMYVDWEVIEEDATRDSLTLAFADDYTYTDGMEALSFDENYNAYWILNWNENGAKANDVVTVGENNEMYVVNKTGKWEKWNKSDSYTKQEIDAMLGEIDSVLDNILNGG